MKKGFLSFTLVLLLIPLILLVSDFNSKKFSKENYSSILESNEREPIDLSFIEESFSFLIVQLNSGNFRVERKELSFTGGTERKVIFAVINLGSFEQIFVLPLDYKISI